MRHGITFRNAFSAAAAAYAAAQAALYLVANTHARLLNSGGATLALAVLSTFVCAGALIFLWLDGRGRGPGVRAPVRIAWHVGLWVLIAVRVALAFRLDSAASAFDTAVSYIWIAVALGVGSLSIADLCRAPQPPPLPPPAKQPEGALGKYEVRGLLGRGAMGAVHDGWDPVIARRVAIKTIPLPPPDDVAARELLTRFRREVQAAGRLVHPNIVSVFDYGETADTAYIVMEFVDGPSLGALLEKDGKLPVTEVLRLMEDVLAGLRCSHEHGIIHRDIKPANIMLTAEGRAKIADFGIARLDGGSCVTEVGKVVGTAAYMSPEQFLGEAVDARSDIFSSGVLLYKLLTGERPFEGSMLTVMREILDTDPPPPSRRAAGVPGAFDAVVARALAKRPEDRYPSAAAFAQAIRAAGAAGAEVVEPTLVAAPQRA